MSGEDGEKEASGAAQSSDGAAGDERPLDHISQELKDLSLEETGVALKDLATAAERLCRLCLGRLCRLGPGGFPGTKQAGDRQDLFHHVRGGVQGLS